MSNLGKEKKISVNNSSKRTYCTFFLNDHLFGIDILDIKEINSEKLFTPIDHSPPEIKGYVNIRGQIYLITKMNSMIGYEDRSDSGNSGKKLILFKSHIAETFGIEVDKIGDIVEVSEEDIIDRRKTQGEGPAKNEEKRKDKFGIGAGVCKLPEEIMVIINSQKIAETLIKRDINKEL